MAILDMMLEHISWARLMGYSCIISLSTRSSISMLKVILTKSPARKVSISSPSPDSCRSIRSEEGGLMSIILSSIEDREVAAEPIIWFMASLMALR